MLSSVLKAAVVGASACGFVLGGQGIGWADPAGEPQELTCGTQVLLVNIAPGNGDYTPALVEGTNQVLVPHAFGVFTGTVYDTAGNVVDSFTEPGEAKGSGKQKTDITCTYSFDDVSDGQDPEFPAGYRFVGSGSVTGKLTSR